jgi:hypothetical protein
MKYTYLIRKIDTQADVMEVEYSSTGLSDITVGMPIPFADDDLEAVIRSYAPIGLWRAETTAKHPPTQGASGTGLIIPDPPGPNHRWDAASEAWVETPMSDRVKAEGARRLNAIAADYTPAERETWPTQVDEATAVLADPAADTPLLSALAAADGVTVEAFAQRVMTNRANFIAASGAILAAQRTLLAMDPIPEPETWDGWP